MKNLMSLTAALLLTMTMTCSLTACSSDDAEEFVTPSLSETNQAGVYTDGVLWYKVLDGEAKTVEIVQRSPYGDIVPLDLVIPSTVKIDGTAYTVEKIATQALLGSGIMSVVIPASVKEIGDNAFRGGYLVHITMLNTKPSEVNVSSSAFSADRDRCVLHVPAGCKSAYANADVWKLFKNIVDDANPAGYKSLLNGTGTQGVYTDGKLKYRVLDESKKTAATAGMADGNKESEIWVDEYVNINNTKYTVTCLGGFANCTSLTNINFTSRINEIGDDAFSGCTGLQTLGDKNNHFEQIGSGAFRGCTGLTDIENIIKIVTEIKDETFQNCTGLTKLVLPANVKELGARAFGGCTGLKSISVVVKDPSAIKVSATTFEGVDKDECVLYVPAGCGKAYKAAEAWGEFKNIEDGSDGSLYQIDGGLYSDGVIKYSLDSKGAIVEGLADKSYQGAITIPANVKIDGVQYPVWYILSDAFYECTGLTGVTVVGAVTISGLAFQDCTGLKSAVLGEGVTFYQGMTFRGCTSLTTVVLPSTITSMDRDFENCTALKDVTVKMPDPSKVSLYNPFKGVNLSKATLHVPSGRYSAYKNAEVWKDFGTIKDDAK